MSEEVKNEAAPAPEGEAEEQGKKNNRRRPNNYRRYRKPKPNSEG